MRGRRRIRNSRGRNGKTGRESSKLRSEAGQNTHVRETGTESGQPTSPASLLELGLLASWASGVGRELGVGAAEPPAVVVGEGFGRVFFGYMSSACPVVGSSNLVKPKNAEQSDARVFVDKGGNAA